MEQVVWKPVVGYEGRYEVSNKGNIRSLDIYVNCRNGAKRLYKGRVKPLRKNNRGYVTVALCRDNKTTSFLLHRIVAEAFVPNIENKTQVNHIDGNIDNNNAYKLEWVTDDENKKHSAIENGGTQRPKRPVIVTNRTTKEEIRFSGLREAERSLGLDHSTSLNVIKGNVKQTKGYVIRYA